MVFAITSIINYSKIQVKVLTVELTLKKNSIFLPLNFMSILKVTKSRKKFLKILFLEIFFLKRVHFFINIKTSNIDFSFYDILLNQVKLEYFFNLSWKKRAIEFILEYEKSGR